MKTRATAITVLIGSIVIGLGAALVFAASALLFLLGTGGLYGASNTEHETAGLVMLLSGPVAMGAVVGAVSAIGTLRRLTREAGRATVSPS